MQRGRKKKDQGKQDAARACSGKAELTRSRDIERERERDRGRGREGARKTSEKRARSKAYTADIPPQSLPPILCESGSTSSGGCLPCIPSFQIWGSQQQRKKKTGETATDAKPQHRTSHSGKHTSKQNDIQITRDICKSLRHQRASRRS